MTPKPVQLELRSDDPALQVNDPTQSKYPQSTGSIAEHVYYLAKASIVCADRTVIRWPIPGGESDAVEGRHIAAYEPEKTV
jgi:hypothetical protein